MSTPQQTLSFTGYWRAVNKAGVPALRGIFCVYACVFDPERKIVSLSGLLYIGAAENANTAVANHAEWERWASELQPDQQLCFTFAPILEGDMDGIKAALIHQSSPRLNVKPPSSTKTAAVRVEGACALLNPS